MSGVNLKNLDLNLLVVFEAIYSAGNISHAATQLAMSQPAVSNSLARLRALLDDQLFVRVRRGVEPTTKAKAIIGPVREALGLIGTQLGGTDQTDPAAYQRRFRISTMDVLEPLMIPPLLNLLAERAPGVTIEGIMARPEIVQDVLAGTVDIACFPYPVTSPDISIVAIGPTDGVIVARRNHPLIGKTLDGSVMNDLSYVALAADMRGFTQIDRELLVHNIKRRIVIAVARAWSMPSIVADTDLVAVVPRAFANYIAKAFDLEVHDFPIEMSDQHLYMMWNTKLDADPAHKWLREHLLAIGRQKLGVASVAIASDNVAPFVRNADGVRRKRQRGSPGPGESTPT
jgi:DNA-binding transcriptional LysR family regulator